MHRFRSIPVAAVFVVFSAVAAAQDAVREVLYFQKEDVLGTALKVGIDAEGISVAAASEAEVVKEILRLESILSGWDANSELRRATAKGGAVEVSAELFSVLESAERWRVATGGAFHPGVGGLAELWKSAAAAGHAPTDAAIKAETAKLTGPAYTLDAATRKVTFLPGMTLTLDAVAKGYILDRAAAVPAATTPHAAPAMAALGGDLVVRGPKPLVVDVRDPRFPADNDDPLCRITLQNRALATSGGYARGYDLGGKRLSHILDPRTGRPVDQVLGASVVAADAATADALATALNVLAPEKGLALVKSVAGAEAVIVTAAGEVRLTEGFGKLALPGAFFGPRKAPAGWPSGYAMAVEFEIQDPSQASASGARKRGGYKRPYVAVWVEDAKGKSVKTLCLWLEDLRWLDDLKRWRRLYRERGDAFVSASSSATRKPGVYTLAWDGRDDDGKVVPEGAYTLFIEIAREHGTYQLARDAVTVGPKPYRHDIEGNVEMKQAKVRFEKKP